MAGLYGGTMTVGELLEHGDLGLGTLDSIDGELIVLILLSKKTSRRQTWIFSL